MTRYNTVLGLLVLSFVSVSALAAEDGKFGFIDMNKAIQSTAAGKKAKADLEAEFNKKKKDLEKMESEIKKKGEEFEKRSMAMNEDARVKKQQEIQTDMRKYQEAAMKSQTEIQKRERDLTKPIVDKIRGILDGIGSKENYTMIFEKSENSVMWAKKDADLTDRVIKEADKK